MSGDGTAAERLDAALRLRRGQPVQLAGQQLRAVSSWQEIRIRDVMLAEVSGRIRLAEVTGRRLTSGNHDVELKGLGWVPVENVFGKVIR